MLTHDRIFYFGSAIIYAIIIICSDILMKREKGSFAPANKPSKAERSEEASDRRRGEIRTKLNEFVDFLVTRESSKLLNHPRLFWFIGISTLIVLIYRQFKTPESFLTISNKNVDRNDFSLCDLMTSLFVDVGTLCCTILNRL